MNNNDDVNKNTKSSNLLINIFGIILLISIISLIAISFVKSKYTFEITASIIILLAFLLVVFLSKSFDDFQIGQIISLKRNVTEYKEKNEKLENDKFELIKQIVNMNVQSQHTANVNYNAIPMEVLQKSISVQQADEKERQEDKTQEDSEIQKELKVIDKRMDRVKFEQFMIKKHFGENYNSILQDVKVENKFGDTDPISNRNIIFDAYYNDNEQEGFIEVKQYISPVSLDRIYVMLNKIYNYNNIKNAKASLTLIIPNISGDNTKKFGIYNIEKLKDVFYPAIASGLLNIKQIEISHEEMEQLYI